MWRCQPAKVRPSKSYRPTRRPVTPMSRASRAGAAASRSSAASDRWPRSVSQYPPCAGPRGSLCTSRSAAAGTGTARRRPGTPPGRSHGAPPPAPRAHAAPAARGHRARQLPRGEHGAACRAVGGEGRQELRGTDAQQIGQAARAEPGGERARRGGPGVQDHRTARRARRTGGGHRQVDTGGGRVQHAGVLGDTGPLAQHGVLGPAGGELQVPVDRVAAPLGGRPQPHGPPRADPPSGARVRAVGVDTHTARPRTRRGRGVQHPGDGVQQFAHVTGESTAHRTPPPRRGGDQVVQPLDVGRHPGVGGDVADGLAARGAQQPPDIQLAAAPLVAARHGPQHPLGQVGDPVGGRQGGGAGPGRPPGCGGRIRCAAHRGPGGPLPDGGRGAGAGRRRERGPRHGTPRGGRAHPPTRAHAACSSSGPGPCSSPGRPGASRTTKASRPPRAWSSRPSEARSRSQACRG